MLVCFASLYLPGSGDHPDDLAVFNRVLSDEQIAALATSSSYSPYNGRRRVSQARLAA